MPGTFDRMRGKIYVCAEMRIVPLTGETHFPLPWIFSDIWEAIEFTCFSNHFYCPTNELNYTKLRG